MRRAVGYLSIAVMVLATASTRAQELGTSDNDSLLQAAPPPLDGVPAPGAPPTPTPPARRPSPPSPFKILFFENDFTDYVGQEPDVFGETLKLMPVPAVSQDATLSFGGQLRHRTHFEDNRLRPPAADENTFQLWRWRNYLDLKHPWFRIYVESIDAEIFDEELPPLPIDRNRWDLLNAFVDLNVYEDLFNGSGVFRYGRQELLYGAQRVISPLDWSNTRRNFHGYKYFHQADTWRLDAFTVSPVNAAAGNGPADELDASFDDTQDLQQFSGGWFTYSGIENFVVDAYYLYLHDEGAVAGRADGHRHTLGSRLSRTFPLADDFGIVHRTWDWEVEGAYQFGSDNGQRVNAGFATAVVGHTWNAVPWSPRLAGLFWYGSGDDDPTDDETNTYNILYPLGHAYWGIIDNLAGQNLLDYSAQLSVKPAEKLVITADFHWFDRASTNDFAYNLVGAPLGMFGGSRDLGEELDIVATYTVNPNLVFQAGYATFWYGTFIEANLPRRDAEFFYLQSALNY